MLSVTSSLRPALPRAPEARVAPQAPALHDPDALYVDFLKGEAGATPDEMAYLDKGIDHSPFKDQIGAFPSRLHTIHPASGGGSPYPALGVMPEINNTGLEFLHPDISNACVCVGSWDNGGLQARWAGRNATAPVQQWSSTKMLPMARLVAQANQASPQTLLEDCRVQDPSSSRSIAVPEAFDAIVSYRQGGSMSNQLAKMFKQFDTPQGLERWVKDTTGNEALVFRGGYGEAPYISRPLLTEEPSHKPVVQASGAEHKGDNLVSSYDLCRFIGEIGWHAHLGKDSQLPQIQQSGVDTLVRGLATDSARFTDVALDKLGLSERIADPVIISKLGFGESNTRHQYEEVYTAFVQFTDRQTQRPYQVALSLRGVKAHKTGQSALELDARMAAQITTILDRVVAGQL